MAIDEIGTLLERGAEPLLSLRKIVRRQVAYVEHRAGVGQLKAVIGNLRIIVDERFQQLLGFINGRQWTQFGARFLAITLGQQIAVGWILGILFHERIENRYCAL